MAKAFLLLFFVILSACSRQGETVAYAQREYERAIWQQCHINIINYSDNTIEEKEIDFYCQKRLQQTIKEDWYNDKIMFLDFPAERLNFGSEGEYQYYRGVWHQCMADVITSARVELTNQEQVDSCSDILKFAVNSIQYRSNDFLPMP